MPIDRQVPIPPEVFTDEALMEQPLPLRFTLFGLRMFADSQGREWATPARLKAALYLYNAEVSERLIEEHLLWLDAEGYLTLYLHDDRFVYAIADWPSISHAKPSRFPPPPSDRSSRGSLESFSAREREEREERESRGESAEGVWGVSESAWEESPDGTVPSPFCPAHPRGTQQRCRNCGTARLAQEQWLREHPNITP